MSHNSYLPSTDGKMDFDWEEAEVREVPRKLEPVSADTIGNAYARPCPYDTIDVYRVLEIFDVRDHAIGHAIKKLLCAGERGHKSQITDLEEAVQAIQRQIQMNKEQI